MTASSHRETGREPGGHGHGSCPGEIGPRRGLAGAPGVFAGLSHPRRYSCINTEKTEKMGLHWGAETNTGPEQWPKKRSFAPEIGCFTSFIFF